MSDEEFEKMKKSIKELMFMTQDINHSFRQILKEISDLDYNLATFHYDLYKLSNEVNRYEFKD